MSKNKKTKISIKLLLSLVLIIFTLICLVFTIILYQKKEKEDVNEKPNLAITDFYIGLLDSYTLLDCNITETDLTFHLKDVKTNDYTKICKNLNNMMLNYKEIKENCNQKNIYFYIYDTISSFEYRIEKIKIDYILYDDFAYVTTKQETPNIEKSNGLLPYEFISYDREHLNVSMDLLSLSLYEKISQIKTLYDITLSMNEFISDLILYVEDKNVTYVYNNTKEITIIEKIEF